MDYAFAWSILAINDSLIYGAHSIHAVCDHQATRTPCNLQAFQQFPFDNVLKSEATLSITGTGRFIASSQTSNQPNLAI
eukprot:scaffold658072_cov64-Prasinocladus_malaysianus.AAC.1